MNYRFHTGKALRRQQESFGDFDTPQLNSEEFDSLQEFALAIASEVVNLIEADREYLESLEGGEDAD